MGNPPLQPTLTRREALGAGAAVALASTVSGPAAGHSKPAALSPRFTPLYPHESATRSVRDLSGLWDFRLDPKDEGERLGWSDGFRADRRIPVPCSWNDLFDDSHDYFGTAWYQTRFHAAPVAADRRMLLRFGSAVYRAKAWLNGQFLGEHLGGHLPFIFDTTRALIPGEPNRLVVMVENRLAIDRVPTVPDTKDFRLYQEDLPETSYDFFPYSGLHRPVWLYSVPAIRIEDITVVTQGTPQATAVEVQLLVSGGWSGTAHVQLSANGETAAAATITVSGGAGSVTFPVPGARLWNPADPFLYHLAIRIGERGLTDEYVMPVGLRTVGVEGEALLLNGKAIQLRGFGKHEDFILHGRGLDLAVLVRDFELLKWIGANSFRTSHYPYAEEAMMLADHYGFLVIDETPGVSLTFSDPADVIAARGRQLKDDITDLVSRDKNHACVVLWSVANEPLTKPFHSLEDAPADAVAKGSTFFTEMFAHIRGLDSTRPATLVSLHNGPVEWASQGDVICTNSYNGWYAVSGRQVDAAATLARELRALHEKTGAKPMIVTEFGADAMPGVHAEPAEMWTEDYQSELIAIYLDVLDKLPFVIGTHPWAFADFKTSQSIMRVGSLNLKGVFTRDRRPKEAARMLMQRWGERSRVKNGQFAEAWDYVKR